MARPHVGEELTVSFGYSHRPQSVIYLEGDSPGATEAQGEGKLLPDEGQVRLGRPHRGVGFGIE